MTTDSRVKCIKFTIEAKQSGNDETTHGEGNLFSGQGSFPALKSFTVRGKNLGPSQNVQPIVALVAPQSAQPFWCEPTVFCQPKCKL